MAALEQLYRAYKNNVQFYIVYVQETRPANQGKTPSDERNNVPDNSPPTRLERAKIADDCLRNLNVTIPCLVDDMNNSVRKLYHGWPARVCIVGTDGKITFISPSSPSGMNPPDMETALRSMGVKAGKDAKTP